MRLATLAPDYRETNAFGTVIVAPTGEAMTSVTPGLSCVVDGVPANIAVVINYLKIESEPDMFSQRQIVNFIVASVGVFFTLLVGSLLVALLWRA
jgi:hypothetical protein